MLLRDINEGETYAYIPGYGRLTRDGNTYCGNLPPARAMQVVRKEKRLVEIRKDSCGRPKLQNQTFVICNLFNVDPTDIMAGELAIVEDKHKDLVVFDTNVNPADLIWPWDMEIKQARKNAEILRQVDRRIAYVEGVASRCARWMIEEEKAIIDAINARALKEVKRFKNYSQDANRLKKDNVGVAIRSSFHVGALKETAYMFLKDDPSQGYRSRDNVAFWVAFSVPGSRHLDSYQRHEIGRFTQLGASRKYDIDVVLFNFEESCKAFEGYDEYVLLKEIYRRYERGDRPDTEASREEYQTTRKRLGELEGEMRKYFHEMDGKAKLAVLDTVFDTIKEKVEKDFGKRLPKFNPKKDWVKWALEEQAKANALQSA